MEKQKTHLEIELANEWFESMENNSYTKQDVFIAGYNKGKEAMDKHAIEFAEWLDKLTPIDRVSLWSKNGEHKGIFNMDNQQLLEIYKQTLI